MGKRFGAVVLGLILSQAAGAAEKSFEACSTEGLCALRVADGETGKYIWLVAEGSGAGDLSLVWGKHEDWFEIPADEYASIEAMIPEDEHMVLPAIDPSFGDSISDALQGLTGRAPKPTGGGKGGGAPSITGGGPLIGGSITVSVGDNCGACHTGSSKEIHRRALEKKTKGS